MTSDKQSFTFEVSNPMLAVALTPFFGTAVPIFSLVLPRLSESIKIVLILVYFVVSITILYIIAKAALEVKKVTVYPNDIEIGKKKYPQNEITRIEINRKTRNISVYLKQRWGRHSYHIKDKNEIASVISRFERWIENSNLSITVKK